MISPPPLSSMEDLYNAYSSGANVNLAMNALSSLVGESEAMAIQMCIRDRYTDEEVPNNSIIVECGDRSRFISYHDIYIQDMYASSFDGEGAITSACLLYTSRCV